VRLYFHSFEVRRLAQKADNPGVERLFRPVARALAIWLDCFNLDQKAIRICTLKTVGHERTDHCV
jgi:hypothetical protein